MPITLRLPGQPTTPEPVDPALAKLLNIEHLRTHEVTSATRDALRVDVPPLKDVRDDDLIEIVYENGVRQWLSAAQARDDMQGKARAAGGDPDEVVIPLHGFYGEATRDWKQTGLRIINVFRSSPVDAAVDMAAELSADAAARKIAAHFESKLDPGPGLYAMTDVFTTGPLTQNALRSDQPYLLFIHGTASSTLGSFSSLALASGQSDASIIRNNTREWAQLQRSYPGRILALEHPTLSVSPIDNAIALANALEPNMTLHLVTHSRGGLVGELLCVTELSDSFLKPLEAKRPEDAEKLRQLAGILKQKAFKIERFVRVACPARGTILVSTRLDWYLSVLLNVIGFIPVLKANPLYAYLKATILELIKRRTKPEFLPGLEAQMPGSPLIHLINQNDFTTKADLAVISGDIEGGDFLGTLKVLATDLFYWTDHDLVVNTDSMYGGLHRSKAYFYFDRGPEVNHFQYFLNHSTRDLLVNWLTQEPGKQEDTGFQKLEREVARGLDRSLARGKDTSPIVVLVPDFMATHLDDGQGHIWLDYDALMKEGLERLTGVGVRPGDLLADAYQQAVTSLAADYQVEPFPYDWRLSPGVEGKRLGETLQQLLKLNRTVHIVAHGFGGLLLKFALAGGTGEGFKRARGRVIAIGTPFSGWNFAEELESGRATIVQLLSLMDITRNAEDVGKLFASFASVQESRPPRPAARPDIDFIYVAGSSAGAADGDGRVLYSEAAGAIHYYVDAAHGDALNHRPAFPAWKELLESGRTSLLRNSPIQPARAVRGPRELLLFPTERELVTAALGASAAKRVVVESVLQVSVLHADLEEARYPVMVGHYQGSNIIGGEGRLDQRFGGALTRRSQMNVYPGPLGTMDVVRMPDKRPKGAIVVGLGDKQAVTPEQLRAAVLKAALYYANSVAEDSVQPGSTRWRSAAFSCVLMGTRGSQPLSPGAAVAATVQALIEANRALRAQKLWDRVRIDAVQFVEFYEDIAIAAAHAVAGLPGSMVSVMEEDERVSPADLLETGPGGRAQRPPEAADAGWWRRIQVQCTEKDERRRYLEYVVASDSAGVKASGGVTQIKMLDHLVARSISSAKYDRQLAMALHSALLPGAIRDQLIDRTDLVLELDRDAAQYPWELLTPVMAGEGEPLVASMGLIRQFKTSGSEQRPRTISARKALIIGDPALDDETRRTFPDLKGARDEASAVKKLLDSHDYQTIPVIHESAHDAFLRLYSEEFQILHLAGHGVYDYNGITGMVLGNDLYLTADDLNNLPFVPEVAFLNCCHLGKIDDEKTAAAGTGRERLSSANRLAASLSEALIKRGAKVVVAAGWAVNDAAALTFAERLYSLLLDDEPFGRAVLETRKEVFKQHRTTNTWGAYQCYGDPNFRLVAGAAERRKTQTRPERSRREYADRLRNMVAEVKDRVGADREHLTQEALDLYRTIPAHWRDGEILGTAGDLLAALGQFELAIEAYRESIQHHDGLAAIKRIEQLGNLEDRYAKILLEQKKSGTEFVRRAAELTEDGLVQVKWALYLGRTPERLSLLGGAYKRLATHSDEKRLDEYLEQSAKFYEEAYRVNEHDPDKQDTYPLLNWITIRTVVLKRTGRDVRAELAVPLKEARELVLRRIERGGDYWTRVAWPDLNLLEHLIAGDLPDHVEELKRLYAEVVEPATPEREKQSVRAQIGWLREVWQDPTDGADALAEIQQSIGR